MILLNGHTMTPGKRFTPESQKLDIIQRGSTSTISMPADGDVQLKMDDWVLDDREPCSGIVWRVKTPDTTYSTDTVAVLLEHAIMTLQDISLFGEIRTRDISGGDTCTAREAAEYVLGYQSIWTLGDFEFTKTGPYHFNGENIFEALEQISASLEDPVWEYDMSSLPFTLHIRQRDAEFSCEMRAGRNLSTLRRSVDRSRMYTRLYPIGKNNLRLTEQYVSRNENLYGRKDKIETDQTKETEDELRAWAWSLIARHSDPIVTVSVSGLEMSEATGEPLDRLVINRLCRIPLPRYRTVITEPITKLSWKDKIAEPENVTLTMSSEVPDIATIMKAQDSAGRRAGRAAAKDRAEDHAWFVDTESHVGMVAEAIIGRTPGGPDWSRVSEIIVDGSGIHQRVVRAEGSYVTMSGRIDANEESLTTAYEKTGINSLGEHETLFSRITQTAESIVSEVSASESRTYTRIQQTKEELEAEIVSAISGDFGPLLTEVYASISGLQTEVGYKSRVYVQLTDPALTYDVHNGDFWIVDTLKRKFSDFNAGETFASLNGFRWTDYYGSVINIRKNGEWIEAANSRMDALNTTKIEEDREHISLIASKLTETENEYTELKVEASQIRAEVVDAAKGFESSLTQTASQIRSEVADTANGMRSSITQTASQIRSEVSAANSQIYSSITQEASQIRSEVADEVNSVRSSITQTASQIRAEVSDDVNSLRSSITATASQIRAEVRAANSQMHSEIAQTASQISMKVSYGEVATRLAVECGNVRVSGGDLIVEGMVSASTVQAAIAGIDTLNAKNINVAGTVEAKSGDFNQYLAVGGTNLANAFVGVDITTSGNNIILTFTDAHDDEHPVTFSRATSLSGVWSSGKLTVTASPQNEKFERTLQAGNPSWSGGLCTIPINAVWGSSGQYSESTNLNVYANINKSDIDLVRDGFVPAGQDPHIPDGAVQVANNFGLPMNNYGYYKFHINVNGQRKDYYFTVDTR